MGNIIPKRNKKQVIPLKCDESDIPIKAESYINNEDNATVKNSIRFLNDVEYKKINYSNIKN